MLQWVWERARRSGVGEVLIATDAPEVVEAAEAFGARVVMTRADHVSGSTRIAEVADTLGWKDDHIVVNVQGDEPLLDPGSVAQVVQALAAHPHAAMATLAQRIADAGELADPAVVKVVVDRDGYALYFSRACIPWPRAGLPDPAAHLPPDTPWLRHVGIYAYRAQFLRAYAAWPACSLETTESLEQLRALWHGARIHVAEAALPTVPGVDTAEDLQRVRALVERGEVR